MAGLSSSSNSSSTSSSSSISFSVRRKSFVKREEGEEDVFIVYMTDMNPSGNNNAGVIRRGSGSGMVLNFTDALKRSKYDVGLLVCTLAIGFALEFVQPFEKFLNEETDLPRLRYPKKANTIPTAALPFLAIVAPIVFISFVSRIDKTFAKASLANVGLLLSVALSFFCVNMIKASMGAYRPDFAQRCWGTPDAAPQWKSYGVPYCAHAHENNLLDAVRQGRRSFPSGHTSMSFSGLFYLTLYLLYWLKCFKTSRAEEGNFVWRVMLALIPFSIAIGIGVSRLRDYWHHPEDVLAGALIGITTSLFSFKIQGFSLMQEELYPRNNSKRFEGVGDDDGINNNSNQREMENLVNL